MLVEEKRKLLNDLKDIVGDRVSVDDAVLWAHSESRMPIPPVKPDAVVLPQNVDEVVELVKYANKEKIPLFTVTAGDADYGGSVPILKQGILIDFSLMNRIWEINETELYALIEPGVTIGQLQKELAKHNLTVHIPSAPHTTGIMGTFIPQQGIGTWPNKYGGNECFVRGVEAILPTGEKVVTGSAAFGHGNWHYRQNLGADLTGIFVGAHGSTGIVTKGAIGVVPVPEKIDTLFLEFDTVEDAQKHINYIGKKEWGDYISGQNYMISLACVERFPYDKLDGMVAAPKEFLKKLQEKRGIPNYWFHISIIGTKKVVDAKREELEEYVKKEKITERVNPRKGDLWAYVREQQGFSRTTGFASRLAYWRGGRMTFHSYCPISSWSDLIEPGIELLRRHGLECGTTFKCLGPHAFSSQIRFVTWYNEMNPKERDKVRGAWKDTVDHIIKNGGTIFRHHVDMEYVLAKEPEFKKLLMRIKDVLDPNGIMNPGMVGLW